MTFFHLNVENEFVHDFNPLSLSPIYRNVYIFFSIVFFSGVMIYDVRLVDIPIQKKKSCLTENYETCFSSFCIFKNIIEAPH